MYKSLPPAHVLFGIVVMQGRYVVGKGFRPSSKLLIAYIIDVLLVIIFCYLLWRIPLQLFLGGDLIYYLIMDSVVSILVIIALVYVILYYNSLEYMLTNTHVMARKGVLFKSTNIVPYEKIQNIDIYRGPLARLLGYGSLYIHTAGYSGRTGAELVINGIEDYEGLRRTILDLIRRAKESRTTTMEKEVGREDLLRNILEELIHIRRLLEELLGKTG